MPRIAYVNGRYETLDRARVSAQDRGFLFADGIYEVVAVLNGTKVDERGHLDRLERSARELRLELPISRAAMRIVTDEVRRRNRLRNALIYIQVTRGAGRRDFKFPAPDTRPTLFIMALPLALPEHPAPIAVATVPDQRWPRRDIKTIALLPQVLAKQQAVDQGAKEAWMVDADGLVTEGASSNAWIVTQEGVLVTRPAEGHAILKGVTRTAVLHIAGTMGIPFEERPFTPDEAYAAREAFVTAATSWLKSVGTIDGRMIGDGRPGPLTEELRKFYRDYARNPDRALPWEAAGIE